MGAVVAGLVVPQLQELLPNYLFAVLAAVVSEVGTRDVETFGHGIAHELVQSWVAFVQQPHSLVPHVGLGVSGEQETLANDKEKPI